MREKPHPCKIVAKDITAIKAEFLTELGKEY